MLKLMTAASVILVTAAAPALAQGDPAPTATAVNVAMEAETRVLNLVRVSNQAEIRAAGIVLERTRSETVRRFADRLLRDHRLSDDMIRELADAKGLKLAPVAPAGGSGGSTAGADPAGPKGSQRQSDESEKASGLGPGPSPVPREEDQRASRSSPEGWRLPQIMDPATLATPGALAPRSGETVAASGPQVADARAAERPLDLDIARIKAERMIRELESADDATLDAVYAAAMIKSHDEAVQSLRTGVQSAADTEVRDLVESIIPILEQHGRLARHVQRELGGEAALQTEPERP